VWRHAGGEHLEHVHKALTEDFDKEESVIGIIMAPEYVTRSLVRKELIGTCSTDEKMTHLL
jgi:hypothetical protein